MKLRKMRYNITNKSFDKGIGAELYPTFCLAAMGKLNFLMIYLRKTKP